MNTITLEKITDATLAGAIAIAKEIFPYEVHQGAFWPEEAYRMAIQEKCADFAYYLAVDPEVGNVGITGHYGDDPRLEDKQTMWLGWFGVVPAHRRKGYGKLILNETEKLIVSLGYKEMKLYTGMREEELAAHRLYKREGYELEGAGMVDGSLVHYYKKPL